MVWLYINIYDYAYVRRLYMSENIFEPLVCSLSECAKVLVKNIKKTLKLNKYDFKDLFKKIELKNNSFFVA